MNCAWVWSIFTDAVIPVLIAVGGVYCAEHYARKRDYKQKKIEIQMEYLRKEITYLAEMENNIYLLSRKVDSSLGKHNIEDREKQYNDIIGQISILNEKNLVSSYMLECFNYSMGINIDICKYKKAIGNFADNLKSIYDDNLYKPVDDRTNQDINEEKAGAIEAIHEAVRLITERMTTALKE